MLFPPPLQKLSSEFLPPTPYTPPLTKISALAVDIHLHAHVQLISTSNVQQLLNILHFWSETRKINYSAKYGVRVITYMY